MQEKLRLVRNLIEKRQSRKKEERFVVEGPHLVSEALPWIDFIIYSENLPVLVKIKEKKIDCYKISRRQFAALSEVETPQGILAVVKEQKFGLKEILEKKNPLIVFCVNVQDPGNLGTIIRTADAAGAAGVILSRGTVDLYNQKVIRSTMGSLFHLPIVYVGDVVGTLEELKSKKIMVIAADASSKKDIFEIKYTGPCVILVGNEGAGLPGEVLEISDEAVGIPMPGKAESLNVGISTAVVLYEALRQRSYGR